MLEENGAGERTRTSDLLITNQLLYQLSYAGSAWWAPAQRAIGIPNRNTTARVSDPPRPNFSHDRGLATSRLVTCRLATVRLPRRSLKGEGGTNDQRPAKPKPEGRRRTCELRLADL